MAKTPAVGRKAASSAYSMQAVALEEMLWAIFEEAEESAAYASGGGEAMKEEDMFDVIETFALNCVQKGPYADIATVFAAVKANTLSDAVMIEWGLNERLGGFLKQAANNAA